MADLCRKHESLPDERDLRDEILELKRQLMVLKRENEQYLIKLRKYEDQAKRKDKQFEELMDPRKNAETTKILSTKGAVILMNLKDQNNTLIQIILNKDLHIRRLMAELKTTKLYATTRKNETYQAEINRLKNLLIKLEQTLKENNHVQTQRSIWTEGSSLLERFSTSNQSSPRDLSELRQTISSLESHIKHSNDLLLKKNQEISLLSDKVNFMRKFFSHKTSANKTFYSGPNEVRDNILRTLVSTPPDPLNQIKISDQDILDIFKKKRNQIDQNQLHSTPTTSTFLSIDSIQDFGFQSHIFREKTEKRSEPSFIITNEKKFGKVTEVVPLLGKSLFRGLVETEIKKEGKIYEHLKKPLQTKEKWKKILEKYRQVGRTKWQTASCQVKMKKCNEKYEKNNETEFSQGIEAPNDKEDITKENCQLLEKQNVQSDVLIEKLDSSTTFEGTKISKTSSDNVKIISAMLSYDKINESDQKQLLHEDYHKRESDSQSETTQAKKEIKLKNSLTAQKNCFKTLQNVNNSEETESKKIFREIHLQNFSSSSDSEFSYSMEQGVQQVQVEAQINSLSFQSDSDQFENNQIFEYNEESDGNIAPDLSFNDDDDVIIRKK